MNKGPKTIHPSALFVSGLAALASCLVGATVALGADAPPTAADLARLQADVARLQQEMREQRQLIFQLMQMDQQRYDVLLKFIQGGTGTAGAAAPALPGMPAMPSAPAAAGEAAGAGKAPGAAPSAPGVPGSLGTITGNVRGSGNLGEAYVYVDGLKSGSGRGNSIEIRQRDKQFFPSVAVVTVGTRVQFPNFDSVIHNVFSRSPGDAFDLGTVKQGEKPNPVVMLKPGHVEVFCSIHSTMRADVLVVPNPHWARVRSDGSFQISDVPVGSRRVVLWGPTLKAVSQKIDLTSKGASTTLTAETVSLRPHTNKHGQAYGSYDE